MRSVSVIRRSACSSARGERVHAVLGEVPAGPDAGAGADQGQRRRRPATAEARGPRAAPATPMRIQIAATAEAGGDQHRRDQHHVDAAPARAGTRRPSPSACSRRGHSHTPPCTAATKLQHPRADGDGERQDGRGRRVIGDHRGRAAARAMVSAGVEHVAQHDGGQLGRIDAAAVAAPEQHGQAAAPARRRASRRAAPRPWPRCARQRRQRMLQLELQRAALAIAGDDADGHERQQERRRQLAGAEGRRPDADERRERLADAARRCRRARSARRRCATALGERDADERAHQRPASATRRATRAARASPWPAASRRPPT